MNEQTSTEPQKNKGQLRKNRLLWFAGVVIIVLLLSVTIVRKSGTVVDAETGAPIAGAVVLVEWTQTGGLPGMSSTSTWKVVEAVTDKKGQFTILGTFNPFTNEPRITIYKKGYVAWNNILIFPGTKRRLGFEWKEGGVYEMERFLAGYKYLIHDSFVSSAARLGAKAGWKQLFISAFEEHERSKMIEELKARGQSKQ